LPAEIRDRLEKSLKEDELDPATRELRDALTNIAAVVREDFGADWHASSQALAHFTARLVKRINDYAPKMGAAAEDLGLGATDAPETIAAIAELRDRDDRRRHHYPVLESKAGISRHALRRKRGE